MEAYKEIEVQVEYLTKKLNQMDEQGYEFVKVLSERSVPKCSDDARGVSYGGEKYQTLLFKRKPA